MHTDQVITEIVEQIRSSVLSGADEYTLATNIWNRLKDLNLVKEASDG